MTRSAVTFTPTAFAAVAVLMLTGCSAMASSDISSQAETCSAIAPFGGVGKLQTASDIVSAVEAGTTGQPLREKAQDSVEKLDEVIATAHRSLRSDLEDVAAVPRAVAEGAATEDLPLEQFRDASEEVRETCFPDKQIQAYKAPTETAAPAEQDVSEGIDEDVDEPVDGWAPSADGTLITPKTPARLKCGSIKHTGYFDRERTGVEVDSYGKAWALMSDGDTGCAPLEGAGAEFVWADEEAGKLRSEFQKIADKHFSNLPEDDHGTSAENVQSAVRECYKYDQDFDKSDPWEALTGTDEMEAIIHGASLEICPGHPQVKGWKIEVENLAKEKAGEAEEAEHREAVRDGHYAEDGGNYLIGSELKPGLYRTMGTKVTECYWETADAQGNIIANNYINTAPQFELRIPATAAAFTISGCEMERIGD